MSGAGKRRLAALAGAVLAVSAALAALTAALAVLGLNGPLLTRQLRHFAPPEATGLREEEYAPVCGMIAAYLRGETDVFQAERALPGGGTALLFNSREQAHMADCAALFALDRAVLAASAGLFLAALAAAAALRRPRSAGRGMLAGVGAMGAVLAALLAWGLADFDGLFITFHRTFFRNDLWLLDPAKDLLIRLMPQAFFVRCAAVAGGCWLLAVLLTALCALRLLRKRHDT